MIDSKDLMLIDLCDKLCEHRATRWLGLLLFLGFAFAIADDLGSGVLEPVESVPDNVIPLFRSQSQ